MPSHEPGAQGSASYQSQDAAFFLSNYRLGKTLGVGSFGKVLPPAIVARGTPPRPPPPPLSGPHCSASTTPDHNLPKYGGTRELHLHCMAARRRHRAGCRSRWRSMS